MKIALIGAGLIGQSIAHLLRETGDYDVVVFDRDTHALIKNVDRASRASNNPEVKKNVDGTVDLYLGAKPPAAQESNWIPADPARKFELMFRLYGPKKEFFDKVWKLPDVEKLSGQ